MELLVTDVVSDILYEEEDDRGGHIVKAPRLHQCSRQTLQSGLNILLKTCVQSFNILRKMKNEAIFSIMKVFSNASSALLSGKFSMMSLQPASPRMYLDTKEKRLSFKESITKHVFTTFPYHYH